MEPEKLKELIKDFIPAHVLLESNYGDFEPTNPQFEEKPPDAPIYSRTVWTIEYIVVRPEWDPTVEEIDLGGRK